MLALFSVALQEEEPSAIRPFTPTVNGTWHSHFIQRTVTIKEKPLTLKELKSLVKTARLPSMRTSTKPTSYTFNSWAPLAIGGGLSYSVSGCSAVVVGLGIGVVVRSTEFAVYNGWGRSRGGEHVTLQFIAFLNS